MIELAMVGMLQCVIATQIIVDEDRKCFYHCIDSSKEFASTLKQYQCPKTLYVDRLPLPFKERNRKNKWTKEEIDKYAE